MPVVELFADFVNGLQPVAVWEMENEDAEAFRILHREYQAHLPKRGES